MLTTARVSESVTLMGNNEYLVRVYNDAIRIKMLQMLQITCRFVFEIVQTLYSAHRNF